MSWIPGPSGIPPVAVSTKTRVATEVSRWDSTPDICDLIDAVVLRDQGSDAEVASQLVAIEVWCKYLRELLRDTGRNNTRAAIVANQAAELHERLS